MPQYQLFFSAKDPEEARRIMGLVSATLTSRYGRSGALHVEEVGKTPLTFEEIKALIEKQKA